MNDADNERMEALFEASADRRTLRISPPVRDEERIANIIKKWEDGAAEQHQLLMESRNMDSGYIGNKVTQAPASRSENLKEFPRLTDWRRRFQAS